MKVSGEVVSVKQKTSKRGPYFGILIVDNKKHRWWFAHDDDACPNKGDKLVVDGKEGDTTEDGEMTILKEAYILESDVGCEHKFLERAGPARYACQDCDVKLNLS